MLTGRRLGTILPELLEQDDRPPLARQLVGPGQRQKTHVAVAGMMSLPRRLTSTTHVESLDTVPNQFLRFALEQWRTLTARVLENLSGSSPEVTRGRRVARRIEARLEQIQMLPAVVDTSPLRSFPTSNTVLTGRAGYREIFRAFLLGNIATSLNWDGGDDVFGAGKRDVATLYEYWVFLELARLVRKVAGWDPDGSSLVSVSDDGMRLELRRGHAAVMRGDINRSGRKLHLELWFNRTFSPGDGAGSSWTATMRPDCSLLIRPEEADWQAETWVHFDAKYRVNDYTELFATSDEGLEDVADKSIAAPKKSGSAAKRDDLRKMHAYRDAIRRSSGAYVLYPGHDATSSEQRREYHELLPGIGAFVLRPRATDIATTVAGTQLEQFLRDVLEHAAAMGTARERTEFWEDKTYDGWRETNESDRPLSPPEIGFQPALTHPPADTQVLLGFVRSIDHLEWIRNNKLYNLRADPERQGSVAPGSPALHADFVVLYDKHLSPLATFRTTDEVRLLTRAQLLASGYPDHHESKGRLYVCIGLREEVNLVVPDRSISAHRLEDDSPTTLSWQDFARCPTQPP